MDNGQQGKNKGMDAAAIGAGSDWFNKARDIVMDVATRLSEFTADDVWLSGLESPENPRALGPVLYALAKEGVIVMTGKSKKSIRPVCHRRPMAEWTLSKNV